MTTLSPHEASASPDAAHRHLGDDVLQSAEEAVLTNPASTAETLASGAFEPDAVTGEALSRHQRLHRYQEELAAYVARKPAQSALMALVAGAALAALLRAAFSRRGH